MSFTEAPFYHYVMMAVGWPSILLYLLVIFTIARRNQSVFRSSFNTMIIAQSVPCISLFAYLELVHRPRKYGFFKIFSPELNSTLAQVLYFGHQYLRSVVIFSFLPFAANRFIAIRMQEKYTKLWTAQVTTICVLTYWIISAIIVAPTLFMPFANFSYIPNKFVNGLDVTADPWTEYQSATASLSIFGTTFMGCLLMYSFTFSHLISIRTKMKKTGIRKIPRSSEILHLISSLIMFLSLIFDAGDNAIRITATIRDDTELLALAYDLWYMTTETICISPPWSLLLASPLLRRIFAAQFSKQINIISTESSIRRWP